MGLRGLDAWDSGEKQLEENHSVGNSYLAHRLKPFSEYSLQVFNMNYDIESRASFVNYAAPLEIRVRGSCDSSNFHPVLGEHC